MDALAQFKETQRKSWAHFAPLETLTTPAAAQLVRHAGVRAGQRVLDVACGTGVVAVTAARCGARATGLDLTPELLVRARENAEIAEVAIDFHEGDAEELPFPAGAFDVVLSEFGHMFAPRPEVALAEMLRVLKPGGTLAFSTWPPELAIGRVFALVARYLPPPPIPVPPPLLWGDPQVIRERLGASVRDIVFAREVMAVPSLSPQHNRLMTEQTAGPILRVVETLRDTDPERLAQFRREFEAIATDYFGDNVIAQDYLMTRATKV
ncbi:MAG TPA: class I SAM-dependent methyltransferase [Candidatus Omnitrophota bacterium]|jgi:SAM-dependent methyltransferase|nr:class I SAM-dependent methyltransferase [Candidatus Omnitrophota bacterium]